MIWRKITVVLLIVLAIVIPEYIREKFDIPITIIDLILFPTCIFLSALSIYYVFTNGIKFEMSIQPMSRLSRLGYILLALILLLLGAWSIVAGWQSPFLLFSGVKGAAHGYTLIVLGLLVSCFSIYSAIILIFSKTNSR